MKKIDMNEFYDIEDKEMIEKSYSTYIMWINTIKSKLGLSKEQIEKFLNIPLFYKKDKNDGLLYYSHPKLFQETCVKIHTEYYRCINGCYD